MHLFTGSRHNCNENKDKYVWNRVHASSVTNRQCKWQVENWRRRHSLTVAADDALSTWPAMLLPTVKTWVFKQNITCVYKSNSTLITWITGKRKWTRSNQVMFSIHLCDILFISKWADITAIWKSQTAVSWSPNTTSKETNMTHYLSKYSHLHKCMQSGVK
jgi:hypothetical protein